MCAERGTESLVFVQCQSYYSVYYLNSCLLFLLNVHVSNCSEERVKILINIHQQFPLTQKIYLHKRYAYDFFLCLYAATLEFQDSKD